MKKLKLHIFTTLTLIASYSIADEISCRGNDKIKFNITSENQITQNFDFEGEKYNFEVITVYPDRFSIKDSDGVLLLIRKENQIVSKSLQHQSDTVRISLKDGQGNDRLFCELKFTPDNGPMSKVVARRWVRVLKPLIETTHLVESYQGDLKFDSVWVSDFKSSIHVLNRFRVENLSNILNAKEYDDLWTLEENIQDLLKYRNSFDPKKIVINLKNLIKMELELIKTLGVEYKIAEPFAAFTAVDKTKDLIQDQAIEIRHAQTCRYIDDICCFNRGEQSRCQ